MQVVLPGEGMPISKSSKREKCDFIVSFVVEFPDSAELSDEQKKHIRAACCISELKWMNRH